MPLLGLQPSASVPAVWSSLEQLSPLCYPAASHSVYANWCTQFAEWKNELHFLLIVWSSIFLYIVYLRSRIFEKPLLSNYKRIFKKDFTFIIIFPLGSYENEFTLQMSLHFPSSHPTLVLTMLDIKVKSLWIKKKSCKLSQFCIDNWKVSEFPLGFSTPRWLILGSGLLFIHSFQQYLLNVSGGRGSDELSVNKTKFSLLSSLFSHLGRWQPTKKTLR